MLIPETSGEIRATPILDFADCIVSAENVEAVPTKL